VFKIESPVLVYYNKNTLNVSFYGAFLSVILTICSFCLLLLLLTKIVLSNKLDHDTVSAKVNAKRFRCQISKDILKYLECLILYPEIQS